MLFSPILFLNNSNLRLLTVPRKGPKSPNQSAFYVFLVQAMHIDIVDLSKNHIHLLPDIRIQTSSNHQDNVSPTELLYASLVKYLESPVASIILIHILKL